MKYIKRIFFYFCKLRKNKNEDFFGQVFFLWMERRRLKKLEVG